MKSQMSRVKTFNSWLIVFASLAVAFFVGGCSRPAIPPTVPSSEESTTTIDSEPDEPDQSDTNANQATVAGGENNQSVDSPTPIAANDDANSNDALDVSDQPDEPTLLDVELAQAGWIQLFDSHSLFGWTSSSPEIDWQVVDGTITASEGPTGLLLTSVPFSNYELHVEFRMEAGGNSGVFVRTLAEPKSVETDCYEINIVDDHPSGYLTGAIVGHAKTESPHQGSGEWRTFDITADGSSITVKLDGETVLDFNDPDQHRASGLIGLQKNSGTIEFRNVRLKPLGMRDLFNETDLTGWHVVPGSKSQFVVVNGEIKVTNGLGFLETDDEFGDFVFQAESISRGDELNSGYFFRSMKGEEGQSYNGYEAQIHNGYEDGDRTKPNNAGTGAIFRRADARRVVSNDHEWFTMTIVAHGPRIAVWVGGYPVVDWEDTREPDENPRRGLRTSAGYISLQGHDPTTDLSFRNLRILEYPGE